MIRNRVSRLLLLSLLSVVPAFATVTVSTSTSATTIAWDSTSGGGSLAISTYRDGVLGTSTGVNAIGTVSANTNLLYAQTFKGNGETLEAFGFMVDPSNTTVTFSIGLFDYGTTGPIDTQSEIRGSSTQLVSATSLTYNVSSASKMYFDFSGADAVTLDATHYYSMQLTWTSGSTNMSVYRLGQQNVYADGAAAIGTSYATLNPNAFNASELRDAIFAVYTVSAVPEPSTYALLLGLASVGTAAWLRRRKQA